MIILFDDLGYNDVGYKGSEIKTPNIDALASQSLIFRQFYVFSWCSATRAATETGVHPAMLGMRSLEHNFSDGSALPATIPTIAEKLAAVGYSNIFLGKWHLSRNFSSGPLRRGYHRAFGFLSGQIDHFLHDDHHGRQVLFEGESFVDSEGHMTDLIYKKAEEKIFGTDRPFFMNISFSAPHYPIQNVDGFEEMNNHIDNDDRRAYAGMVTHADYVIGKLIDLLDRTGDLENTYIFLLSDNGAQKDWSNPKFYSGRFAGREVLGSNQPLRSFKTSVYEGGIRVPFLLYAGTKKIAKEVDEFATVLDLAPTIANLTGAEKAEYIEGLDLFGVAAGSDEREINFYWQTRSHSVPHGGGRQEAIRLGDFKLVRSQRRFAWLPYRVTWPWDNYELFNIADDMAEEFDLSDERPDLVDALSRRMDEIRSRYQTRYMELDAREK